MHHVDGRLTGGEQLLQRLVQRHGGVGEQQRHRAFGRGHHGGGPPGPAGQVFLKTADVPQRRRHQQELRLRQFDQRHLPGPAPVRVGVVMELVHDHLADVGGRALPQRDVGQHLGGAADDGGGGVDARVAGHHADVLRPEYVDQGEELLRHQRLDRGGVERDLIVRERGEVGAGGDQALAGPGRGGQDHVAARHDLDQRLLLVRVQGEPLLPRPAGEGVEDRVGVGGVGEQVGEQHGPSIVAGPPAGRQLAQSWCRPRCPGPISPGDGISQEGRQHS